jgi:hypothetical protein
MNEEGSGKSHASAWVGYVLVAVVLYLLSVVPLFYTRKSTEMERLFDGYAAPYRMLGRTPLRGALEAYEQWYCSIRWGP